MRKLRRILSVVMCVALVFCLCSAASASGIVFLAVNDSIPVALSADTMPFYHSGLLYVPATLFDVEALNIIPVYSTGALTISSGSRSLMFDLNDGTMTTESGSVLSVQVISRSGVLFVPASQCAAHFGLGLSVLTSLGGYTVVRLTTGSQVYDDVLFIEKANNLIEYRVSQYLGTDTPTTTPTPDTPGQSTTLPQTGSDAPPEDDEPVQADPAEIYLAITNAAHMESALYALNSANLKAAFFFTYDEILSHADLVLQLYTGGHTIGLIAGEDEAEANEMLDRLLHTKALCRLTDQTDDNADINGISFLRPSAQPDAAKAAEIELIAQLYVVDSADVPQTLSVFQSAGANLHQLRETTQF